jgi:hypothetical protein
VKALIVVAGVGAGAWAYWASRQDRLPESGRVKSALTALQVAGAVTAAAFLLTQVGK